MKIEKALLIGLACVSLTLSCSRPATPLKPELQNLTKFVDPFIGTGGHGHVFIGANVPYGAVQLGPTELTEGWDWCSGYHYSDSLIIGFAHSHLSGAGSADLGDISFMPATGPVKLNRGTPDNEKTGFYSKFNHKSEVATPGYYQVHLDRYNIDVQLTATKRVGFHQYTFPASDEAKVIIDLENGLDDLPSETFMIRENDTVISGYRSSQGWATDHRVWFYAIFSKPIQSFQLTDGEGNPGQKPRLTRNAYGVANFSTTEGETILIKVGISPVSTANAKLNILSELNGWDFEAVKADADRVWNLALNKIQIGSSDTHILRTFYTGLYHTMIAPSIHCDVNGDYFGTDRQIHTNNSFTNYTTFSLWDTYRTAHPLMNLISPEMVPDIGNTMLAIYREQGQLPIWHMMSNETYAMVGNPGAVVLADMVLKGFDINAEEAWQAMKASAMKDERGIKWMKDPGFIPYDKESRSVAKALEYGLADWSIAQVAKKLGHLDDYNYFIQRSKAYKHYYDPETRFLRPKNLENQFRTPFDPLSIRDYVEGNAWQYLWLVPQDVNGLISLFGSDGNFITRLDSLFMVNEKVSNAPDVTGLIGQYAHGNEPSHHILYLYPYAGQPWKTAERVREVMSTLYSDQPDGLSGNEDVGQMSAWYVLSALGFYPVAPAGDDYVFGSPLVDEAVIQLKNNRVLRIIAKNNSPENIYIQRITFNGKVHRNSFISYETLTSGGTLQYEMGPTPSKAFGVAKKHRPVSND